MARISRKRVIRGQGIINTLINKLPFEAHIPGYNFCGPGTRLQKRLDRGDKGVNPLDEACKAHDIAYAQHTALNKRHEADKLLAERALARFKAKDASWGEKAAALGVTGIMKAKTKIGMGRRRRSRKPVLNDLRSALAAMKKKTSPAKKRVLAVPKRGGILPLIPIFAALSAMGALGGGAAGIAKAVNDAKSASKQLQESERHNKEMEAIARGKGLYLRPYKTGAGVSSKQKKKKR